MGDFAFAGEHSSLYQIKLLKSPISILPGTRDKVIVMPGRHGSLRMLPDLGERTIRLECWLQASGMVQLYQRLERVRAWLNPLRGEQRLVFDDQPDKYYLAAYTGGGLDAEVTARQGLFSLAMVCTDPFLYAVAPDVAVITGSPHSHNQRGTAPADPLFRLQGNSLGGTAKITIQAGLQGVTFTGPLSPGDWLEIDCAAKTAVRVAGEQATRVLHLLSRPVFPQLTPGENQIAVTAAGGASWSRLDLHCRNRWI